MDTTLVDTTMY